MAKHWCNAALKKPEILTLPEPLQEKYWSGSILPRKFHYIYKVCGIKHTVDDQDGSRGEIGALPSLKK
jgi:hypothetical protein